MDAQIFTDFGENLNTLNLLAKNGGYVMIAQIFADFVKILST